MVLDTGSAETVVIPEVLDELGYSARTADRITVMRSAVGREQGYLICVHRFACLGYQFSEFQVRAHDLPDGWVYTASWVSRFSGTSTANSGSWKAGSWSVEARRHENSSGRRASQRFSG